MNERIKALANKAGLSYLYDYDADGHAMVCSEKDIEKLVKAIVEETLTQVAERAYYTGDRDWSDDVDRQWIQLEFGYGPLADAQKGIFK